MEGFFQGPILEGLFTVFGIVLQQNRKRCLLFSRPSTDTQRAPLFTSCLVGVHQFLLSPLQKFSNFNEETLFEIPPNLPPTILLQSLRKCPNGGETAMPPLICRDWLNMRWSCKSQHCEILEGRTRMSQLQDHFHMLGSNWWQRPCLNGPDALSSKSKKE